MKVVLDVNVLNCFFQCIIAVAAVVAIWITIKQISGKGSIHIKLKTKFDLKLNDDNRKEVVLVIHMVNLGMAPVYISSCGIELYKHKHKKYKMRVFDNPFVLKPGYSKMVSGYYLSGEMDDKASLRDKVRIYLICQMDKVYYEKKRYNYDEFKHEYEKVLKRIDEKNIEKDEK